MKRFLALMLAICLMVGGLPAAQAVGSQSNADGDAVILPDHIPSPWAYEEVRQAIVLGMVPTSLQTHWRSPVTRIEFAQMAVHFLAFQYGYSNDSSFVSRYCAVSRDRNGNLFGASDSWWSVFCGAWGSFTDLSVPEERGYGNTAYALGILNGRSDTIFDPDSPITRQEAAAMLMRCYQVYGGSYTAAPASGLWDLGRVADWARADVDAVLELRVMKGAGGAFSPEGTFTREQAVITLLRLYANAPVSRGSQNVPEL